MTIFPNDSNSSVHHVHSVEHLKEQYSLQQVQQWEAVHFLSQLLIGLRSKAHWTHSCNTLSMVYTTESPILVTCIIYELYKIPQLKWTTNIKILAHDNFCHCDRKITTIITLNVYKLLMKSVSHLLSFWHVNIQLSTTIIIIVCCWLIQLRLCRYNFQ